MAPEFSVPTVMTGMTYSKELVVAGLSTPCFPTSGRQAALHNQLLLSGS